MKLHLMAIKKTTWAAILIFTFIFLIYSAAPAQEIKSLPEMDRETRVGGPVDEAREFIETGKLPELEKTLNGKPVEELEGHQQLADILDRLKTLRGQLAGQLLLYDNLVQKYETVKEYDDNPDREVEIDGVFQKAFTPTTADFLVDNSPYQLSDAEKQTAFESITDMMELLVLTRFEENLKESGKINPEKARIFYDNAIQKTKNRLVSTIKKLNAKTEEFQVEYESFAIRNVLLKLQVGDSETYSGVKKNFEKGQPLVIGVNISCQGVSDPVPLEWKMEYPDGRVKMGKTSVEGGSVEKYVKFYEGQIPGEKEAGKYTVEVVAFPGRDEQKLAREHFSVRGLPFEFKRVFTLDKNKKSAQVFKPGDTILLAMLYEPLAGVPEKAKFSWRVFGPAGKKIPALSKTEQLKTRTSSQKIQTKYIKAVIPAEAKSGTYNYQAVISYKGKQISSRVVKFDVKSELYVKIEVDHKKVKRGRKVTFTSKILGGIKPYKYLWEADTGESSTHPAIAIIFSNPGKRWVKLTVIDSSKPKPLKEQDKVFIEVIK